MSQTLEPMQMIPLPEEEKKLVEEHKSPADINKMLDNLSITM